MARVNVKIKSERSVAKGYLLDISRSGMCVACDKRFGKDKAVEIETEKGILPLLTGRIVSVSSSDAGSFKHRLGIQLIGNEKVKAQKIKHFVNKQEQRKAARLDLC